MPSKTTKKARRAAAAQDNLPVEKDDGSRWVVMRDGRQVYYGTGVTKRQARTLCDGLRIPAEIVMVVPPKEK